MKISTRILSTAGAAAITLLVLFAGVVTTTPSAYAAGSISVGGKAIVTNTDGDNIRVRDGAGSKYDQVGEAHEGETVSVLAGPSKDSKGNSWYKIKGPGGTGWIHSDFLEGSKSSSSTTSTTKSASSAPKAAKLSGSAKVSNTDGDNLRIRKAASQDGAVLTTILPGVIVSVKSGPVVDSEKIAWYQVTADGTTGWAMAQYLVQASTQAKSQATTKPAAQAQPAVQKETKPAAAPAPQAAAQAAAQPAEARTGEARGAQQPASAAGTGSSIVNLAMRYVGYRYRFGGTGPSSFDCSGFVYYVVNRAGIGISRNMFGQYTSGPRVSTANLQPGDLLFFSNTYKRGLSHAGIYIGNGKFIHAENESTGVTVSALWSAYWAAHYTTAVRVR